MYVLMYGWQSLYSSSYMVGDHDIYSMRLMYDAIYVAPWVAGRRRNPGPEP